MEILKTRRDSAPPKNATLLSGQYLNTHISSFLSGSIASSRQLIRIAALRRPPSGATQFAKVSTNDSDAEAWLYYGYNATQTALYIVTDAHMLFLNANSSGAFQFSNSSRIQTGFVIDLSGLNISLENVAYADYMFESPQVGTIRVRRNFQLPAGAVSTGMFNGCTRLIGGAGTAYDSSHTDGEYARIDNPPGSPGYFTRG